MRRSAFDLAWLATLTIVLGPLALGLVGALAPSLGFHPAFGLDRLSLDPWRRLFEDPATFGAIRLSATTGLGATAGAVAIAFGLSASLHHHPAARRLRLVLAPALALPHASFAIGLAFLAAPSGWLARLVSPGLTGWIQPPDLLIINDPHGLALAVALTLKETLFLLLMIAAAMGQTGAAPALRTARSLGYGPVRAWLLVVLPRVYPQVRLPIYAVLATALSVVDMALILGPSTPSPLAPLILSWATSFEIDDQLKAAAGAVLQLALVLIAIGVWRLGEWIVSVLSRDWRVCGRRFGVAEWVAMMVGGIGGGLALAVSMFGALGLLIWSFSARWTWPGALPQAWSLGAWRAALEPLTALVSRTLAIAVASTLVATGLALACLEAEEGRRSRAGSAGLIYLPLLLPQIGFLFGVQILWSAMRIDGGLFAVIWTHLLFVLPYVYLALADPFRALDPRLARTARSLGHSRLGTLIRVKTPLLVGPLLIAAAVGFAVSVGQYLPTVLAGAGRVETLTTEAVALASGGDRRLTGVMAFTQALLPFLALVLALGGTALAGLHRNGLRA